jgi:hypothetical protein
MTTLIGAAAAIPAVGTDRFPWGNPLKTSGATRVQPTPRPTLQNFDRPPTRSNDGHDHRLKDLRRRLARRRRAARRVLNLHRRHDGHREPEQHNRRRLRRRHPPHRRRHPFGSEVPPRRKDVVRRPQLRKPTGAVLVRQRERALPRLELPRRQRAQAGEGPLKTRPRPARAHGYGEARALPHRRERDRLAACCARQQRAHPVNRTPTHEGTDDGRFP